MRPCGKELVELEYGDRSFTAEELAELDSDWGSSSDKFKHDNFQGVAKGPGLVVTIRQ